MIGKLPQEVLEAVLETIRVEFSVVDATDRVLAWNKPTTRIFKRPGRPLGGSEVANCHPKKSLAKVEKILKEMKEGKKR